MGQVTCPNCKKVLKAPDTSTPRALRCPACKQVFEYSGNGQSVGKLTVDGRSSAFAVKLVNGIEAAGAPLPSSAGGAATILSDADEAMLREFGSGSGLLELTREAYTGGVGDVHEKPAVIAPAPNPSEEHEHTPVELERQFQIVGTALTLANKLVLAHKGELGRTRSAQRLALIVLTCLALLLAGAFAWAMTLRKDVDVARKDVDIANMQSAGLQKMLDDEKARSAKKDEDLAAAAKLHAGLQEQFTTAKSDAARAGADLKTRDEDLKAAARSHDEAVRAQGELQGQLKASQQQVESLNGEVKRLTSERDRLKNPTTQPK